MNIRGSICALATPFAADGALDLDAFGRLLDYQLAGGTEALVVAGSTGEAHMLEHDEFERLLAFAVERVAGRVPVLAGTGEAGTAKTVALTRRARELGADAALVVVPYYVRPTQEGMRRHFLEVAEHGGLPVVLYNVPARTASDLLPATVAALREHPAIVGIKEARGDAERIQAVAELARPGFVYLSGDDGSAGQAMLAGAAGTISVVANLVPKAFRALCDAATGGDEAATARSRAALEPLLKALDCAPNPIAVKAGLPLLGLGSAVPRLPLVELSDAAARARLREALATLASLAEAA
ncbi:4-hydroxy-tetrahydrodipicolinate synthase [Frateuria defendens]|uniref:4-hydroxy-tetrahydrodipicolinate synthase n=1 Tax=Frateuria defendens TaxID=2219559 RepID=UPI00066FB5CE|nr:4-hydroxy-tetrahydrodipicolinate synthase [Frateuria defendens]